MPARLRGRRHLSVAVAARTILAGCEQVRVALNDAIGRCDRTQHLPALDAAQEPNELTTPEGAGLLALLDWHGVPHLMVPNDGSAPTGGITLTCTADPSLGALILEGSCAEARSVAMVPGLIEHLSMHQFSLNQGLPGAVVEIADLLTVPVNVEDVTVIMHGPSRYSGRRAVPVPVAQFQRAIPDNWTVQHRQVAEHLESHHQAELCALVVRHTNSMDTSAVVLREIGPTGMALTCLTATGVSEETIRFEPPLSDPAELGMWFHHNH